MNQKRDEKKLHGNKAKIDPDQHVESLYQSNMATLSSRKEKETPLREDENVSYAKGFVEENKK